MKAVDRARYLYPWGITLAKMMARACTISQITGLTESEARSLYKEARNGKSSPSGQQPVDIGWYTQTPERQYQSALLLLLYERARRGYPPGLALAHAYYHFSSMTAGEWHSAPRDGIGPYRDSERDYAINFARGNYLVNVYNDQKDLHGARKSSLMLIKCRLCRAIFLSEATTAERRCPLCVKARERMSRAVS
jgi:hypothetical protein